LDISLQLLNGGDAMNFRLTLYQLVTLVLPKDIQNQLAEANFTQPFRDALFREGNGKPRMTQVRASMGEGFLFTGPIQVASKAQDRGIEPTICRLILGYCTDGMVCIDVGASYGFVTLTMCQAVNPGGRVLAFEPNSIAYMTLKKNISDNHFDSVCLPSSVAVASVAQSDFKMVTQGGSSQHP
jgi:hypothetical protein